MIEVHVGSNTLQMHFSKLESSLVHRLLLHPTKLSIALNSLQLFSDLFNREGSQLFNPNHLIASRSVLLQSGFYVKSDFTSAEDHLCNDCTVVSCDNWLEVGTLLEVTQRRVGLRVLQSDLRCCNHKWFAVVSVHLASQDMIVVGWHCALSKLEVDALSRQIIVGTIPRVSR